MKYTYIAESRLLHLRFEKQNQNGVNQGEALPGGMGTPNSVTSRGRYLKRAGDLQQVLRQLPARQRNSPAARQLNDHVEQSRKNLLEQNARSQGDMHRLHNNAREVIRNAERINATQNPSVAPAKEVIEIPNLPDQRPVEPDENKVTSEPRLDETPAEPVPKVQERPLQANEAPIDEQIKLKGDVFISHIDQFLQSKQFSAAQLKEDMKQLRSLTTTEEQKLQVEKIFMSKIEGLAKDERTRNLPRALMAILTPLYNESNADSVLAESIDKFNASPESGLWRVKFNGDTLTLQEPEVTFWEKYGNLRDKTEAAKKELAGLQNPTSKDMLDGVVKIMNSIKNQKQYLKLQSTSLGDAIKHEVNEELQQVEKDLLQHIERLGKAEDAMGEAREKILRKDTDGEYQRVKESLERRISAFEVNARNTRKDINDMDILTWAVADIAGTISGMEKSIKQDLRVVSEARRLLGELESTQSIQDVMKRRSAIDNVRLDFGMSRPDYRDANAALARSVDRLEPYDLLTRAPERLPFQVGQEVYALVNESSVEKGWIIQNVNKENIQITKNGETITLNKDQVWHVGEIEGGRALNSNVPRHVMAEMQNRKYTLLSRYARIDSTEYHRLFDGPLQQQNVGNCYLIATFESLKNSSHAETVLRTSVSKEEDGYTVKIPLGDADGEPIKISREEMGVMRLTTPSKGRNELRPVAAAEGWVVLEAAFTKKKFGTVDREASEGGFADSAISLLLGNAVDTQNLGLSWGILNPLSSRSNAEEWLNNFSTHRSIATVSRGTRLGQHIFGSPNAEFSVGGQSFLTDHAYALLNVDSSKRQVVVANPHDTAVHIRMTYDQFFETFNIIRSANINYNRIFKT